MKMIRLEKWLVNRTSKADRNVDQVCRHLDGMDRSSIRNVLEIGCGMGAVAGALAERYGFQMHGVDIDPDQIALARLRNGASDRLHFSVAGAGSLPFATGSLDFAIAQNVFHHMPDWRDAVGELARVLRPAGHLMWYDFAFPDWVVACMRPIVSNYGVFTLAAVQEAFAVVGLHVWDYRRVPHGPFGHYELLLVKMSPAVDHGKATRTAGHRV